MKNKLNLLILFLIVILVSPWVVNAQSINYKLTGSLQTDSKILFENSDYENLPHISFLVEDKKSPMLAGLMSLVIPGAGEFYAESYWKTAVFVAIEAAVITTAVVYDNKGDDQTTLFQNYADDYKNPDHHWSVVKYAEWLNEYHNGNITINEDVSLPPWERVNWTELNNAEVGSHKLYPHGDQQYYEMIGKYHQFSAGWNDFPETQASTDPLSPNFNYYSGLRGKANDYYNVASKAVIGIYVNHFLSALDAVWTTISYNKSLAVKMRIEQKQFAEEIELVPTLRLSYNF